MLFNEPKLLKLPICAVSACCTIRFSALQRAEIAEIDRRQTASRSDAEVSVLFNEPKLLKFRPKRGDIDVVRRFSALQRAEIAEIERMRPQIMRLRSFSALQRAEIAEIR